jgi:hypothetical protein
MSVVATEDVMLLAAMAQYPPPKYTRAMAVVEANIFPTNSAMNVSRKLICRMNLTMPGL